jgi:membrane protein
MHTPVRLPAIRQHLQRLGARAERSLPVALMRRFIETDLMTQAASLSFYALLSLAPLLILLLWFTASLYPQAQEALVHQIGNLAGHGAQEVAGTVIDNADSQPDIGSLAGAWSTVLLFLGAAAVFARLQAALNLIFRSDASHLDGVWHWIRKRLLSFGVVFALGFLLLLSMTLSTVMEVALAGTPSLLPMLSTLLALLIYAVAFALLFHYLPDRRVAWHQSLLGGALTAVLFLFGRHLIDLYIEHAAPGSAYGTMGTLVVLLVWMYYATVVFFIGALLTAVINERARIASGQTDPPKAVA